MCVCVFVLNVGVNSKVMVLDGERPHKGAHS